MMRMLCLVLLGALLVACAPTPAPGQLEGHVTIGPLTPVEKAGETPAPIPPEVCTARAVEVFKADAKALAAHVQVGPDCTYRVTLAPGSYVVDIAHTGIDRARDLPRKVTIASGQTVQLDVDIDTGIR